MEETFIELTEDQFDEQFTFVINHMNPSAGWVYGNDRGCLFETYGEELAYVKRQDDRRVWTLVDGDDGDMYVISGFHYVNRVGYLISRDPIPDNVTIQVHLPMQVSEESEDGDEATEQS
jgi:hypothetical protein